MNENLLSLLFQRNYLKLSNVRHTDPHSTVALFVKRCIDNETVYFGKRPFSTLFNVEVTLERSKLVSLSFLFIIKSRNLDPFRNFAFAIRARYLSFAVLACVSQKTRKLLGPGNRPAKLPKRLSGVSQSTRKILSPKNTSFSPVNFTGTHYLPRSVFGS